LRREELGEQEEVEIQGIGAKVKHNLGF